MKKIIWAITILGLFIFPVGVVEPADTGDHRTLTGEEIEREARDFLLQNMIWEKDQMKVSVKYSGKDVSIPNGTVIFDYRLGANKNKIGNFAFALVIKVNDTYQHRLRLKANVKLFYDVVRLRKPVKRNQIIAASDIELMRIESAKRLRNVIADPQDAVGYKLTRNLGRGDLLTSNVLKKSPLVKNGDHVTLILEKGSLRITAPGVVKEKGYKNSSVKAINAQSKKVVYGKVIDEHTLKVIF